MEEYYWDYNDNGQYDEYETFEDYKERRKVENSLLNDYSAGVLIPNK